LNFGGTFFLLVGTDYQGLPRITKDYQCVKQVAFVLSNLVELEF